MQHVCFLISILYFLNIHSCNIWIILWFWSCSGKTTQSKIWQRNSQQQPYPTNIYEFWVSGDAIILEMRLWGISQLGASLVFFSAEKKSLVFLPLCHLQLIILRLNHTSCQLITFSKQRLNFCGKSLSCGLDTDIGFTVVELLMFFLEIKKRYKKYI